MHTGAKGTLRLQKASFTVGRDADVKLPGSSISGAHARFEWRGARLFITDLESAGGTVYDGTTLMPGVAYAAGPGAIIRFGATADGHEYKLVRLHRATRACLLCV